MDELRIAWRPPGELIPYARNPRTHSDAQVAQIAASIRAFGWTSPILVDGRRGIVAGHGRCFAYAPDDGRLLWSNELKGLGYGAVALRYEGAVIAQQVSYLAGKHTATMEERQYG